MNFRFSNLLGAPYRGGNLLIHGNELLTPVGNRVAQVNLVQSTSYTLPFENLKQVRTLCVSPDGTLLLSVDEDGKALLINKKRKALLHHFSFKGPVSVAKFSPDGQYIAAGVGRLLQVWRTPSLEKQMAPMQLHRTYGHCHSDVLDLDWSHDSQFIAVASKDIVARVFSLEPIQGYEPPLLAGHKNAIAAVFFTGPATRRAALVDGQPLPVLCTLSRDGALLTWTFTPAAGLPAGRAGTTVVERTGPAPKKQRLADGRAGAAAALVDAEVRAAALKAGEAEGEEDNDPRVMPYLAGGKWAVSGKHYLNQRGARVSCAAFHTPTGMLVAGLTNGLLDMYSMPGFDAVQVLSVSRQRVSSVAFNAAGDWVAVGCAQLGQLLVWEWRSETYVLKQQGHFHDVAAAAFSPDGATIATGSDDRKVKLFQVSSGFCYVTFNDHTAPVTSVAFLPSGNAVVSASLDGTVRAFDLLRYRNFRTLTSPRPVQFVCLAVDPGGELIAAGTIDTFQVFVWSLKTGRLLDVLAGHEGPVSCLAFSPVTSTLASGSWDKTVRTWDVFAGKGGTESLQHSHDVLALAVRPDGKQLAAATLNGDIVLWDPIDAVLQYTIEGRRDIRGGRLQSDRRAAGNSSSGTAFRSLAYSADGSFLIAGGMSRYVVIYDVDERIMLRKFAVTSNRSLDGVLDTLNSRHMTDAGPLQLIDHDSADEDDAELLPVSVDLAAATGLPGTGGNARKRPLARTRCLALSPTGRCWAACTTEGLQLYSLDDDMVFDPTDLTEDLTPAACRAALRNGSFVRAALIALRLKDSGLLRACMFGTPLAAIGTVAPALPPAFAPALINALAECLAESAHAEFVLMWARALCTAHGRHLEAAAGGVGRNAQVAATCRPALRALHKAVSRLHEDLAGTCEATLYSLEYLLSAGQDSGGSGPAGNGEGGGVDDHAQASPEDDEAGEDGGEGASEDGEDGELVPAGRSLPLVSVARIGGRGRGGRGEDNAAAALEDLQQGSGGGSEEGGESEATDNGTGDKRMPGWG